jgi:hypothetical protein
MSLPTLRAVNSISQDIFTGKSSGLLEPVIVIGLEACVHSGDNKHFLIITIL